MASQDEAAKIGMEIVEEGDSRQNGDVLGIQIR